MTFNFWGQQQMWYNRSVCNSCLWCCCSSTKQWNWVIKTMTMLSLLFILYFVFTVNVFWGVLHFLLWAEKMGFLKMGFVSLQEYKSFDSGALDSVNPFLKVQLQPLCYWPSLQERRNVRVGSISFLILMSASRTIGPQLDEKNKQKHSKLKKKKKNL